jgi:hypothetical protein
LDKASELANSIEGINSTVVGGLKCLLDRVRAPGPVNETEQDVAMGGEYLSDVLQASPKRLQQIESKAAELIDELRRHLI